MTERRTQAERSADSQSRLINAAIELLATNGYARTSLVEIGKLAGTSRGLVTHHFGTKEACMQAVVQHIREEVAARILSTGATGVGGLDRAIDIFFELLTQGHAESRAMYVIQIEGITSTPGLRAAVAESNASVRAVLTDVLLGPGASKKARRAVEPLLVVVEGQLRGVAVLWMADPDGIDLRSAISTMKAMVRREAAALGVAG